MVEIAFKTLQSCAKISWDKSRSVFVWLRLLQICFTVLLFYHDTVLLFYGIAVLRFYGFMVLRFYGITCFGFKNKSQMAR